MSEERHTGQMEERNAEYMEDRTLCETFANRVVEAYGDQCLAVVFLPWSQQGQPCPVGVIAPSTANGLLSMNQLRQACRGKSILLAGCTFKYGVEEQAARRIVEQLQQMQDMCILCAQLLPPEWRADRAYTEQTRHTLQRIIGTEVDDVLLDPDPAPARLKSRIKVAHHSWTVNRDHLGGDLRQPDRNTALVEIRRLERTHQQLLWQDIPGFLMPSFTQLNSDLVETENGVGSYTFVEKLATKYGVAWKAKSNDTEALAIKIIPKSMLATPGEVEAVNREYCFLSTFLTHPNIVRTVELLHGKMNIYMVLEWAGPQNVSQYLAKCHGHRLPVDDALSCFRQVASALAHCHDMEITHRSVSCEHIVLKKSEDNTFVATLVDFRTATVSKVGADSRCTSCGKLPYMAPETLLGRPCNPMAADCWSIGTVLLETAGGLGSFFSAVNISDDEVERLLLGEIHRVTTANRIQAYFNTSGNHAKALSHLSGNEPDEAVVGLLTNLLRAPGHRPPMRQVARIPEVPLRIETITSDLHKMMDDDGRGDSPEQQ